VRFRASLAAKGAGERRLLALTDERARKTDGIHADAPSSWRKFAGADFVIITPVELAAAAERLKALRQSQGLATAVVAIEDIYDEFSFGEKSPFAVRDFLALMKVSRKKGPRFVLLAGDASYDPKNYLGAGDNDLVPTRLIETEAMETASDDWFSDFDNDGIADIATGRLPARTAEAAARMVHKIIAYEGAGQSKRTAGLTDRSDGFDFETPNQTLASRVATNLRVTQINRDRLTDADAKQSLIDDLRHRPLLVNYAGHGSATQWRGGLLASDDGPALNNEHLPLFVMMTCLNGYFHDANIDSLGESLLKPSGGAAAVWASTGMCLPEGQALMNQDMYRHMFSFVNGRRVTLGEAAMRSKSSMPDIDVRRTWVLLGDPCMRLR